MAAGEQAGLGRLPAPDVRDRSFLLQPPRRGEEMPRRRFWSSPGVLDQGETSQCVAYSTTKWLIGGPVTNRTMPWSIEQFYHDCQQVDEWPGDGYDGTSVRAAFKLLKERGYVTEYRWAFDHPTLLRHVLLVGPAVLGTDWHMEMFMSDRWGYIEPVGEIVGGHAYKVVGASQDRVHPASGMKGAYRIVNSWGPNWADSGRAWLAFDHADALIKAHGEACTATEKKV